MKAVAIVGLGNVGGELARQLLSQHNGVSLVACCNSRYMRLCEEGFQSEPKLDEMDQSFSLEVLLTFLCRQECAVLVDCTASLSFPSTYSNCLQCGVRVVTANKSIFERPWSEVQLLVRSPHFAYEATCGAGLPIISTMKALVATGDTIERVTGLLSGTLAYVFSELESGTSFSAAVLQAKALGFTEPDPRDDLSGRDVQRKLLVLARTLCLPLEAAQVLTHSLVPADWAEAPLEDFLRTGLMSMDVDLEAKRQRAAAESSVLRFVADLDVRLQTASVQLQAVAASSALGQVHGTDNVFHIVTQRYPRGLTISGAGAGPAVTAMGIFTDILGVR